MLLSLEDVGVIFETRQGSQITALEHVSLEVLEKEFLVLVGPSGCGKSTLLRLISGLLAPSTGTVSIRGRQVTGPNTDVGVVFQDAVLLPWLTVFKNVLLPVSLRGRIDAQAKERGRELLAMVGLADFAEQYPFELSGGMRQRVSICRALVSRPSVLVMDEPFAALDAISRETLNFELLRIHEETEATVIFITHSIPEAVLLANRVAVMSGRPGRVVREVHVETQGPRTASTMVTEEFAMQCGVIRQELGIGQGSGHAVS